MQSNGQSNPPRPLEGARVLEMGQILAGPFAAALLAWFGAEVIKLEPPQTGDPLRKLRKVYQETSLWWYILGRNKQCVTLNLKDPRAPEIAKQLVEARNFPASCRPTPIRRKTANKLVGKLFPVF
jgi:formyl-CoA transferase